MWMYNLYDDCTYENNLLASRPTPHATRDIDARWRWTNQEARTYWGHPRARDFSFLGENGRGHSLAGALNDYPCGGPHAMFAWVNTSEARDALHVARDALFFSGDNGVGFNYHSSVRNTGGLVPFFQHVIANTTLRVLVYNGDTDPCINSFEAQNWTSNIGVRETEAWRAWTLDGKQRMGGYVTEYEGGFSYLTIRGSGHMVPEFKPAAAEEMIKRWLKNERMQQYVQPRSRGEL